MSSNQTRLSFYSLFMMLGTASYLLASAADPLGAELNLTGSGHQSKQGSPRRLSWKPSWIVPLSPGCLHLLAVRGFRPIPQSLTASISQSGEHQQRPPEPASSARREARAVTDRRGRAQADPAGCARRRVRCPRRRTTCTCTRASCAAPRPLLATWSGPACSGRCSTATATPVGGWGTRCTSRTAVDGGW